MALQIATICGGGWNRVGGAVHCSRWTREGLGSVEHSESFNRLTLASLFNTLSSVPVG